MSLDTEPGFADIVRQLQGLGIPSLGMYKEKCLRRRLGVRMRACGVHSLEAYAEVLSRIPGEADRLLATLTINVTHFFRNEEAWSALGRALDGLLRRQEGPLRAWSAGCATGEEPYTLGMLVAQLADAARRPSWLHRAMIDATDVDEECLARARSGRYARETFGAPLSPRARPWMRETSEEALEVVPEVHDRVRFLRHDLGRDTPPEPPYHVIICRNVVIYFERDVQERLFASFAEALAPGGLLLLGKVETLLGPARDRLELVDLRERLYRRPLS